MYRFWNSRSFASASRYCSCRRRVISSHSARVTPCSLLTFSAVWIIAPPAQGSFPKLSMTQSSEITWPPGPFGLGHDCLLYTSDAADDLLCVDLGGRRIIKKKNTITDTSTTN